MATVIFIKESKQTPSAMRGCIRYCVQEKKTVDENGQQYVGGVNCRGQHAYEEFMAAISTANIDHVKNVAAALNARAAAAAGQTEIVDD